MFAKFSQTFTLFFFSARALIQQNSTIFFTKKAPVTLKINYWVIPAVLPSQHPVPNSGWAEALRKRLQEHWTHRELHPGTHSIRFSPPTDRGRFCLTNSYSVHLAPHAFQEGTKRWKNALCLHAVIKEGSSSREGDPLLASGGADASGSCWEQQTLPVRPRDIAAAATQPGNWQSSKAPASVEAFESHPPAAQQKLRMHPQPPHFTLG